MKSYDQTGEAASPFRVEFSFEEMPPTPLIEQEYKRLGELKEQGIFVSLDLKPDRSGGRLEMRGQNREEIEAAVRSVPLYPYAEWTIHETEGNAPPIGCAVVGTVSRVLSAGKKLSDRALPL